VSWCLHCEPWSKFSSYALFYIFLCTRPLNVASNSQSDSTAQLVKSTTILYGWSNCGNFSRVLSQPWSLAVSRIFQKGGGGSQRSITHTYAPTQSSSTSKVSDPTSWFFFIPVWSASKINITLFTYSFSLYSVLLFHVLLGKPYIHNPSITSSAEKSQSKYNIQCWRNTKCRFQEALLNKYFSWKCQLMTETTVGTSTYQQIVLPGTIAVLVHCVNVIHYGIMILLCRMI
jgi:hypothetical protein